MIGPSKLSDDARILGIESSCDETAASVVTPTGAVLSSVIASQEAFHAQFGGVVPEIASRRHAEVITAVVEEALRDARTEPSTLSLIAVTNGPGLVGSLVVGAAAAKAYALAWNLPVVAVNHVEAHFHAAFLHDPAAKPPDVAFPILCLIVSGGHTDLIFVSAPGEYELLGCTRDDAAGEALDKVARLLGLGFPGGPAVERAATEGSARAFPLPMPNVPGLDFSFAGLKSALARHVESRGVLDPSEVPGLAASFQETVMRTLWLRTLDAVKVRRPATLVVAGGVAANARLKQVFAEGSASLGLPLIVPPPTFCTDNAAMVALCGAAVFQRRGPDPTDFDVFSALPSPGERADT
jgi:N6-L-threonylcarbamoyladenine synthase